MVLKWDSQQAMKPIAFDQDDHVRSEDSFLDIAVVSRGGRLNSGWKKVHLFARSAEIYHLSARTHACFHFCIFFVFCGILGRSADRHQSTQNACLHTVLHCRV